MQLNCIHWYHWSNFFDDPHGELLVFICKDPHVIGSTGKKHS